MKKGNRLKGTAIRSIAILILALVIDASAQQAKTARLDSKINTDTGTTDQVIPSIAVNRYGYAVIVWQDERGGASNERVYGQILDEKGIPVLGNSPIDDFAGEGSQYMADVAINDRGHFAAVWVDTRDGRDIMARMFHANGAPKGDSFRVNGIATGDQTWPAVSMDTLGNFAVTWTDERDGRPDIYLQRYDVRGMPVGGNVRVNTGTAYSRDHSDVFLFNDGTCVVVWQDSRNAGVDDIFAQRYDAGGNPSGGNAEVSTHPGQETVATNPAVAGRENGDFLVCWQFIHPSGINDIYGRLYGASGVTLKDPFLINEIEGGHDHTRPDAAANPAAGWGVAWETNREGTRDIRARSLTADGNASGSSARINDAAGTQNYPRLGIDGRGIALFVWTDDRNGNPDVYGSWSGSLNAAQWKPLNPYAGSGFDGMVPLTWDPVYGQTAITRYHISRSVSATGPFSLLTTVNLTDRGTWGGLFRDWLDTGLENDRDYYYTVTAEASGVLGPPSNVIRARPQAGLQELRSAWAIETVAVDGLPEPGWEEAESLEIDNGFGQVVLGVKNNEDTLFIGLFNARDDRIDAANAAYILFDANNDGLWDAASPSGEGVIIAAPTVAGFNGIWGTYPNGLGIDASVVRPAGVKAAMAAGATGLGVEIALDLHTSPLKATPGQTVGFGIWLDDPGSFYPTQYGYAAEWPQGLLRENAATLGDLVLASPSGAEERPAESGRPASFGLYPNYPNPFNPETSIPYSVPEFSRVRMTVYDLSGSPVRTLVDAERRPGRYTAVWDGRTELGAPAPSGVYLVRLEGGKGVRSRKLMLIR